MTIDYAILGMLSWQPLTGYDIKKSFKSPHFFTGQVITIRYINH